MFLTASTSLLAGCSWNAKTEVVEVVREVRKPLPEAYLEHCGPTQSGRTIRSVIADYKQALDECNGQLDAIRVLTNPDVELAGEIEK